MFFTVVSFLSLLSVGSAALRGDSPPYPFDVKIANNSVWLSAAAYCDNYSNHVFKGPSEGFVYTGEFSDKRTDMLGYFGYQTNTKQIFVVYRGSSSGLNWLDDFQTRPVNGEYPDCTSCKVHNGFKMANDNTFAAVLAGVTNLVKSYPDYQLVITGHSLGGGVSTLSALSFKLSGFDPILYAVASPRVGNSDFAAYYASLFTGSRIPQRLTHLKDIVPHVPFTSMGFLHIVSEVYEDESHVLHACSGNEDPTCADQWRFAQTNGNDHLLYLNHVMSCDD